MASSPCGRERCRVSQFAGSLFAALFLFRRKLRLFFSDQVVNLSALLWVDHPEQQFPVAQEVLLPDEILHGVLLGQEIRSDHAPFG